MYIFETCKISKFKPLLAPFPNICSKFGTGHAVVLKKLKKVKENLTAWTEVRHFLTSKAQLSLWFRWAINKKHYIIETTKKCYNNLSAKFWLPVKPFIMSRYLETLKTRGLYGKANQHQWYSSKTITTWPSTPTPHQVSKFYNFFRKVTI